MADRRIMKQCFNLPEDFSCETCEYADAGIQGDYGPCGQQNCWYSCTVCSYNGMCILIDEEEEEEQNEVIYFRLLKCRCL